ncbi:MAG: dATP pyrophosphohydrolase [Kiloniellaceae bacterium]
MTAVAARAAGQATDPSPIRIEAVRGRRQLDRFIRLPGRLYAGHAGYVEPLTFERRAALGHKANPYFQHAKAEYWLAWRGARLVGRISAQIDDLSLERYQDATGHFGLLDAEDDPVVFAALIATAEDWLRDHGMRRARGPFNLSINEESGLLIEGFHTPAVMMMGYAPPYAGPRVEALGYAKVKDLIAYDYDVTKASAGGRELLRRAAGSESVELRMMNMARYHQDLGVILDIFNDAWSRNWGFVPFTEAEMTRVAKEMRPLIRPEMVWIASINATPAAMIVCLPNLNEAIADLDGRLLPFGWLKLLWRLKFGGLRTSRVVMMGLRRAYRNTPLGSAVVLMMIESLRARMDANGFHRAELSWVLEDNRPMRAMIEGIGGDPYKVYRIYEKALG